MRVEPVKNRARNGPTRRKVLAAALGLPLLRPLRALADDLAPMPPALPEIAAPPWWVEDPRGARVVHARSEHVAHGAAVNRMLLGDLLDLAIRTLTGAKNLRDAWRSVLGDAQRIAIKFNSVGARVIGTNDALALVLLQQLRYAGYPYAAIQLVEARPLLAPDIQLRPPPPGWGPPIRVAGNSEPVAAWWHAADAVINVPLLKTHQIAGFSGSLKNISHAIVAHPARYHANGCSPFVPEIVAAPEVAARIRLTIMNALRIVFRNGPDAVDEDLATYGSLLLGYDPVAIDHIALAELMLERRRQGEDPDVSAPHLDAAARMRVGRSHPASIERELVELRGA